MERYDFDFHDNFVLHLLLSEIMNDSYYNYICDIHQSIHVEMLEMQSEIGNIINSHQDTIN